MKKKILTFLPLATIALPIAAVSCQKEEKERSPIIDNFKVEGMPLNSELNKVGSIFDNKTKVVDKNGVEHEVTLWDYFHAIEGEIISTADGDTVTIKVTKQPKQLPYEKTPVVVNDVMSLRISNIDTLEENTAKVSERERKLAEIDHAFADGLILNKTVRVISSNWGNQSYNRYIANVFYGDNFERNFGVDMLHNGYTLARLDKVDLSIFESKYESGRLISDPDIRSLLMPYLAFAINDAYQSKRGFYNAPTNIKNPIALSREYGEHGEDMIDNSSMILLPEYLPYPKLAKANNNIYKYFESLKK